MYVNSSVLRDPLPLHHAIGFPESTDGRAISLDPDYFIAELPAPGQQVYSIETNFK